MFKVKGGAGGGASKSKSKAHGSTLQTKTVAHEASADVLVRLRSVLRDANTGTDRDLLASLTPFCLFQRNNLDVALKCHPGARLSKDVGAHKIKALLNKVGYDCAEDRVADMREPASRMIVVTDNKTNDVVAAAHVRVSLQGELIGAMAGDPCLIVLELAVDPTYQRKGLGKHMMSALELSARKHGLDHLMLCASDEVEAVARAFVNSKLKGFVDDATWAGDGEALMSKALVAPTVKAVASPVATAAPAKDVAMKEEASPESVLERADVEEKEEKEEKETMPQPVQLKFDFGPVGGTGECQEEEDDEDDEDETDRLMDELCEMYEAQHGTAPTEEVLAQWRATLADAAQDAAMTA
ncbi:N-alpha-acetyltransferase 40 [Pycnococcus provasolii]